jgi:hypothetical protein
MTEDEVLVTLAQPQRAINSVHLTQSEKQQINTQQNKVSKQIYKDKHNGKRQ